MDNITPEYMWGNNFAQSSYSQYNLWNPWQPQSVCCQCFKDDDGNLCCCCPVMQGPPGPPGLPGQNGQNGKDGASGCCCKDAVKYALEKIYALNRVIEVHYFNQTITGTVQDYALNAGKDFFVIDGKKNPNQPSQFIYTVSACNVQYFEYTGTELPTINPIVDTPDCCCNSDLAAKLKSDVAGIGAGKDIEIMTADNNAAAISLDSGFVISNGVIFGKGNGNKVRAVMLCSVFAYSFK